MRELTYYEVFFTAPIEIKDLVTYQILSEVGREDDIFSNLPPMLNCSTEFVSEEIYYYAWVLRSKCAAVSPDVPEITDFLRETERLHKALSLCLEGAASLDGRHSGKTYRDLGRVAMVSFCQPNHLCVAVVPPTGSIPFTNMEPIHADRTEADYPNYRA